VITDLGKEAFKVFEDGREQSISFFAHHSDVPMNVGVLLDTSTSLSRTLGLEAGAAGRFFDSVMRENDLGFLVSYASRIETLQVPTEDSGLLTRKAQTIRRNAKSDDLVLIPPPRQERAQRFPFPVPTQPVPQQPDLRVARLYDAVGSSVDRFLSNEVGRKALVIVALADDARSNSSLRDALRTLQQNDVIAYVMEVEHAPAPRGRDDCDIRHIFNRDGGNRLDRLAEETGGRVIKAKGFDKMQEAFDQIAEELHQQYSLGYRPANQKWDGGFRKLEIKAGRDYRISARDGYYATARN
jgi:VWFA-related protein